MHFIFTLKTRHSFVVSSPFTSLLTNKAVRKIIFQKKSLNLLEWLSIKIKPDLGFSQVLSFAKSST